MKRIFLPLMAVAMLASCSEDASDMNVTGGQPEIKLASQALDVTTKAPFEGTIGSGNPLRAFVPASSTPGDYTMPYDGTHGYMQFADNGTTAVGFVSSTDWSTPASKQYPADENEYVYLCGLYPYDVWSAPTTTATATIDGKTDLMAAEEVKTNKKDVQTGGTPKTLQFKHLLTRLNLEIAAENQDAKDAWGNVTSLKLTKVLNNQPANQAKATLADGTAIFSGTADTPCYTDGDGAITNLELPITSADPAKAYVLCQPVDASTGTGHYTLAVTTTEYTDSYEIPLTLNYDQGFQGEKTSTTGQAFTVTLTFKATTIQAKAEVTPWEEAGSSEGIVQ